MGTIRNLLTGCRQDEKACGWGNAQPSLRYRALQELKLGYYYAVSDKDEDI
jgi:hypothetical protein